jgi:hypothetical protein
MERFGDAPLAGQVLALWVEHPARRRPNDLLTHRVAFDAHRLLDAAHHRLADLQTPDGRYTGTVLRLAQT